MSGRLSALMFLAKSEVGTNWPIVLFSWAANPKRARLFHDKSLANEDTYEPFLS